MSDIDADTCERILRAALKAGDIKGVEAALLVMATVDPGRAKHHYDALQLAVSAAQAEHPQRGRP